MKGTLLSLSILLTLAFIQLSAQTPIDLGNGFKPWGSYDGGKLDSVDLQTGNLILHAPLLPDYPQRGGKLNPQVLLYVSSRNWQKSCATSNTGAPVSCVWKYGGTGVNVVLNDTVSVQRVVTEERDPSTPINYADSGKYTLTTWDGASHLLSDVSGGALLQFVTTDGTGWRVAMSNPDQYGIYQTANIIDRTGVQSFGGFGMHCSRPNVLPPPSGLSAANGAEYGDELR